MIAIPAIDLRGGACVQLAGGAAAAEHMRLSDPVHVAREFQQFGFARLHVIDRDAVMGKGDNRRQVRELLEEDTADVQVGGGLRTNEAVEEILEAGARYAIVGTRALEDLDWLAEIANTYPGEIILAADVRERRIVNPGWQHTLPRDIFDLVDEINSLQLAALLVTAVHKVGQMLGVDLPLMEDVVEEAEFPVYAAGGVGSIGDLWALHDRGVHAAVIGMALYSQAIDPRVVAEEFAE